MTVQDFTRSLQAALGSIIWSIREMEEQEKLGIHAHTCFLFIFSIRISILIQQILTDDNKIKGSSYTQAKSPMK